jgi:UDP-N-acetylglucosamine 2-epimerase (non-hydrolysing)
VRVICVAGARPNFMKVAPLLSALDEVGVETILVHTGQHYDPDMSDVFFDELGMRAPDHHLGIGSGSHAEQTAKVMVAFEPLLAAVEPDVVVVVGDVNSTLACALVTAKALPLLAHVEAGLRSNDWTMPEEINRVVTDRVSDLLFAPSADAVDNLRSEGLPAEKIHLVGNVMVDSLLAHLDAATARPILTELGISPFSYGLVTLHRPSTVDEPILLTVMSALAELSRELPLVFPVHPRVRPRLSGIPLGDIRLIEPAGYLDFIALESQARVVLTDSGGVQEETTILGVPCLTLRESTERPITVTEGTNTVVGRDPVRILREARRAMARPMEAARPHLWDGLTSHRIATTLSLVGPIG